MLVIKSTPKVLRCTQATASTHYNSELMQSAPTLIELQDVGADNITIIENSEDSFQVPPAYLFNKLNHPDSSSPLRLEPTSSQPLLYRLHLQSTAYKINSLMN